MALDYNNEDIGTDMRCDCTFIEICSCHKDIPFSLFIRVSKNICKLRNTFIAMPNRKRRKVTGKENTGLLLRRHRNDYFQVEAIKELQIVTTPASLPWSCAHDRAYITIAMMASIQAGADVWPAAPTVPVGASTAPEVVVEAEEEVFSVPDHAFQFVTSS